MNFTLAYSLVLIKFGGFPAFLPTGEENDEEQVNSTCYGVAYPAMLRGEIQTFRCYHYVTQTYHSHKDCRNQGNQIAVMTAFGCQIASL